METALLDIAAHNLQNRTIALIENGSWAPTAGKLMRGILSKLKDVTILNETLTIKSSLKDDQLAALAEIADALVASMPKPRPIVNEGKQNPAALFKFQYGLFALSAREGDKDNACIINTAIQMANKPERISISVIKANYTCGMIERTGVFNLLAADEGSAVCILPALRLPVRRGGGQVRRLERLRPQRQRPVLHQSLHERHVLLPRRREL